MWDAYAKRLPGLRPLRLGPGSGRLWRHFARGKSLEPPLQQRKGAVGLPRRTNLALMAQGLPGPAVPAVGGGGTPTRYRGSFPPFRGTRTGPPLESAPADSFLQLETSD